MVLEVLRVPAADIIYSHPRSIAVQTTTMTTTPGSSTRKRRSLESGGATSSATSSSDDSDDYDDAVSCTQITLKLSPKADQSATANSARDCYETVGKFYGNEVAVDTSSLHSSSLLRHEGRRRYDVNGSDVSSDDDVMQPPVAHTVVYRNLRKETTF